MEMEMLIYEKPELIDPAEESGRQAPMFLASGVTEAGASGGGSEGGDRPGQETEALVAAIRDLRQLLVVGEDKMVAGTIRQGCLLVALKERTATRTWGGHLKSLEIHPRVASRLMKVGSWDLQIGLNEADLRRLPNDLLKLERIAGLDRGQLDRLLELIDCRKKDRPAVIKAVKQVLGVDEPDPEDDADDRVLRAIERILGRLIADVNDLGAATPGELRERLRNDLAAAMDKLANQ
jgi:hypothetical protein